jgi:hypothetical protein
MKTSSCTRYCCQILGKLEFLDRFSKKFYVLNFIKIRPVEVELVHADGQTDMTKLIVAFRNFVNAPKNYLNAAVWSLKPVNNLDCQYIQNHFENARIS